MKGFYKFYCGLLNKEDFFMIFKSNHLRNIILNDHYVQGNMLNEAFIPEK